MGVGHLVGQLAKHYGCDVTASASSDEKATWLEQHGIRPHRYRDESAEQLLARLGHDGFDVIVDTVGGDHLQESFILAKERGKIISIATRTTQDLTPMHSKALTLEAVFVALPLLKGKRAGNVTSTRASGRSGTTRRGWSHRSRHRRTGAASA